jgi:hypothetical protein
VQLRRVLPAFAILAWLPASAATLALLQDRHVYLDTNGNGQLNDCPNPTHAADGTGNAAELEYCPTTTPHKFICDPGGAKVCKSWTVTSASCPGKVIVTSGSSTVDVKIDVDGDGTEEFVYGHPQACLYNADPSDKCDIHAGTYKRGGTMSDWNVNATASVTRSNCWTATVGALGEGKNPAIGTDCTGAAGETCGYGSKANPFYLRGAEVDVNHDGDVTDPHEIDTWDENGNKIADSAESLTSYPVVFSGDANLNGTPKEPSVCTSGSGGANSGDAFYPLMWGCGAGFAGDINVCNHSGPSRPKIDTDANGTFDFNKLLGRRDVSWFHLKNIEATGYGGGPATCSGSGVREKLGNFSLGGDGSSSGFVGEGIYFHDNAYSTLCQDESFVAVFGDDENGSCSVDTEIKNSNIKQDNRFLVNDDSDSWDVCGNNGASESGCGWYIHDNKIDVVGNPNPAGCTGQFCRKGLIRFKSVDTLENGARKKQFRIVNNDITWETTTRDGNFPWMIQTECIGTCGPVDRDRWCASPASTLGLGEFWFYGNIFHFRAGATAINPWAGNSCTSDNSPDMHSFKIYEFNNTWDGARAAAETAETRGTFCNETGKIYVNRNNAFYRSTSVAVQSADTVRALSTTNRCTESGQAGCQQVASSTRNGTNGWWSVGTWGVASNASLPNYIPKVGGPLDGTGSCDPDGDGIQGVDYDNNPATGPNGGQETSWTDIAGNVVDCSAGHTNNIGAIQKGTGATCIASCGDGVVCASAGETCDDGSAAIDACIYGDSPPFTQVCNATCNGLTNCANPAYYGDGIVQSPPEACDGSVPPGTVCPAGCTGGAPTCIAPGVITNSTCTGCGVASGTDRHVFLDTDGDGKLNQCPNPAHNTYACAPPAVPCNTANLERCNGGANVGKVRGDRTGYVSTCSGGAFVTIANGDTADVDGDGINESVYLTPQACVWDMAKSDSCEIHAGTYKKAGATCDGSCGDQSGVDPVTAAGSQLEGTLGVCDKFDCFKASVVALGDGPHMDGTGYGTSSAPGYLEAARENGSFDSWDTNGDKQPDGSYSAILSGDDNGNGVFDATTLSGGSLIGDSFYGVMIGCGKYGQYFCRTSPVAGSGYIRIDTNGDGVVDTNAGNFNVTTKEVHYLQIRDLEFTRYNGGNGAYFAGVRPHTSIIDLNGAHDSSSGTNGLVVDHIYLHDNDFTLGIDNYWDDNVSNEGYTENHWSGFNDQTNFGATTPTVIENSFLVQNNARLFNFDCGVGGGTTCGNEIYIHDNRILVDVDATKAGVLYRNCVEGGPVPCTAAFTRTHSVVVSYIKHIDLQPQRHRFWNNEFVIKSMGTSRGYFMDLQGFGNAENQNGGAMWLYGNLFRDATDQTLGMSRFWQGFCDINTGGYDFRMFNNTFDLNAPLGPVCSSPSTPGDIVREKNNVFMRTTSLAQSTATIATFENVTASTTVSDRALWFNPGTFAAGSPGVHNGLANYVPRIGNALYEKVDNGTTILTPCDPDRDGVTGVDNYDGLGTPGVNETTWRDIAGNVVNCLLGTNSYGAIQPNSDGAVANPTMIKDATLKSATPK